MAVNVNNLLKSVLKEIGTIALGGVIITTVLITYLISIPVFIFRYALTRAAKTLRPELGSIISAQGNVFSSDLFSSKAPRCTLVIPIVIEGSYTESYVSQWFGKMVEAKDKESGELIYPEFKQYLEKWFGFPFWRNDPDYDIKNHVKYGTLLSGEDGQVDYHQGNGKRSIVTEKEAIPFIEQLLNRKFDLKKSPWEMYVLSNYEDPQFPENGPKTLLILRIHHTLADGYSILYALVEGLLRSSLTTLQLPNPNYMKRGKLSELLYALTIPFRIANDLSQYAVKGLRSNPWLVTDRQKSWKQYYGKGKPYPIDKIKEIKDELKVSFTSVLLAAISASITRSIRNKLGNNGEGIDKAAFFIPLPLPGHPNALRNHVTGAQIDLPLGNYSDPILRVRECEALINEQKRSTIPMVLMLAAKSLGLHISSICGQLTANRANISGLTSFPAGSSSIEIGDTGKKVLSVELAAGALTGVSGAAFMALSYQNDMRFGLTAESAVLNRKEVDQLLKVLIEELELLYEIVVTKKLDIPPSC